MKKNKTIQSSFLTSPRWTYVGAFALSLLVVFLAFRFQHRLEHFRSFGLFGIFLLNFIASSTVIIPAPAIVSVVIGGHLYPPLLVGLFASGGAALGNMVGYFVGRAGKHIVLTHDEYRWYKWLRKKFHTYGTLLIFLFAFVPNPIFDALALIAGITEYSPIKLFFLMFVARFVRDTLLAMIGARF